MGPNTGKEDYFESQYTLKFQAAIGSKGIFLKYEKDRAGIDLGIHLYEPRCGNEPSISTTRIWFQLKGIHSSTKSKEELLKDCYAKVPMSVRYLKYYYFMSEPVFLVVYLEALDTFIYASMRGIVDDQLGGVRFFSEKKSLKRISLMIPVSSRFTDAFWTECYSYKSINIRPPLFRGRSLGHKLDPLRCSLDKLDSAVFLSMMNDLLESHGYSVTTELPIAGLFSPPVGDRRLTIGCLFQTWEWSWQLSHEFCEDEKTGFRQEGKSFQKQGTCGVLVDGDAASYPDRKHLQELIAKLASNGADELLVFANTHDSRYFGAFFGEVRGSTINCIPQLLGDIPYNLLQNQIVFKKYIDKLEWHSLFYLEKK